MLLEHEYLITNSFPYKTFHLIKLLCTNAEKPKKWEKWEKSELLYQTCVWFFCIRKNKVSHSHSVYITWSVVYSERDFTWIFLTKYIYYLNIYKYIYMIQVILVLYEKRNKFKNKFSRYYSTFSLLIPIFEFICCFVLYLLSP